jgi:hypothetical protein
MPWSLGHYRVLVSPGLGAVIEPRQREHPLKRRPEESGRCNQSHDATGDGSQRANQQ